MNILKGFVALFLIGAGTAKLLGVPELHESFSILGLPTWFGYFIGACEIAGAIGLFISPLASLSALIISIIMVGAIYFHVQYTPLYEAIMGVFVLISCIYIGVSKKAFFLKFKKSF